MPRYLFIVCFDTSSEVQSAFPFPFACSNGLQRSTARRPSQAEESLGLTKTYTQKSVSQAFPR